MRRLIAHPCVFEMQLIQDQPSLRKDVGSVKKMSPSLNET